MPSPEVIPAVTVSAMPATIVNLSCYKFTPLDGLEGRREQLLAACRAQGLKGTILLAPEGINFFLAGTREQLEVVLGLIRGLPGLADLAPKESPSSAQPFKRMLVKVKKEIIAFGVTGVDPARRPSPKLPATELKRWLDEGRPVVLLDTRNEYEVRMGTFRGALAPPIWNFRDFPRAVADLPPELKERPVVMFCTGGIRCEKAGPYMESLGYKDIHQLDGGILKYFEEVGGAHYDGECFVFDERVGVDPALRPTRSVVCFNCQMPLTIGEQRDVRYVYEKSCPHCIDGKPKGRGNTATEAG
jgi:UPF0176 protein